MNRPVTMTAEDIYNCASAGKKFPDHILIDMPDKEGIKIQGVDFGPKTIVEIHNKDVTAIGIVAGQLISHDNAEKELSAFTIGKSIIGCLDISNKSSVNIINMHFLKETHVDGVAAGFQFIGNQKAQHLYLNDVGISNPTDEISSVRIYQNAHLYRVDIGSKGSLDYDVRSNPCLHTFNIHNLPVTESAFFLNNPALDKTGEALIFGNDEEEDMYCCTTDNEHFVYTMVDSQDFLLHNFCGNKQGVIDVMDSVIEDVKKSTRARLDYFDPILTNAFTKQHQIKQARYELEKRKSADYFLEQARQLRAQNRLVNLKIRLAQNRIDQVFTAGKTRLDNLHKHKHYFQALLKHYYA